MSVLGIALVLGAADLRASDPRLWPGFPALENGDVNSDGAIDLSDPIYLLGWLYADGPDPAPIACATAYSAMANGDSNGDGQMDVSDPIHLLSFLFSGGPGPAEACGLADGTGAGSSGNPRVLPAHASAFGKTLGEWTAAWWQWALSLPADAHPLLDSAGCDAGQAGWVWFLGGAFTGTETTRDCTVPTGKAILFPIVNVECSTIEPPPFFGSNEEELRACAASFQDMAFGLSATIDGRDVANVDQYRVQSPVFEFTAPDGNIFGLPGPISGQSVSDGVWILLAPLSRGSHTIHFQGSFPGFPIVVTYNITVE
jgi:hypothetical protein